jgi:hypothetical protein
MEFCYSSNHFRAFVATWQANAALAPQSMAW